MRVHNKTKVSNDTFVLVERGESASIRRMRKRYAVSSITALSDQIRTSSRHAFCERTDAVFARRTATDDDYVEVIHCGKSSPDCSRTM